MENNKNGIEHENKRSEQEEFYGLSESDRALLEEQEENYQNYKKKARRNVPKDKGIKIKHEKKEEKDSVSKLENRSCIFLSFCLLVSAITGLFMVGNFVVLYMFIFPITLIFLYWLFSGFLKDYISCKARVIIFTVPLVFLSSFFGIVAILLSIPVLNIFIIYALFMYDNYDNFDPFLLITIPLMYSISCAFVFLLLCMYKKIRKNDL